MGTKSLVNGINSHKKISILSATNERVPNMDKRNTMNLLLVGALSLPVGALALPYALFFVPRSAGGGSGGTAAKDALGNDIKATEWLKVHRSGDRTLSQGLKGDSTGKVVRGPAPLSLSLASCEVNNDLVTFKPWTVTDFRTGTEPWWK